MLKRFVYVIIRYEWRKNSQVLQCPAVRCSLSKVDGAGSVLVIRNASSADEGVYQCIVSQHQVKVMSNTSTIRRAYIEESSNNAVTTVFRISPGDSYTMIGSTTRSYPQPKYSWMIASGPDDPHPVNVILDERLQMDEHCKILLLWYFIKIKLCKNRESTLKNQHFYFFNIIFIDLVVTLYIVFIYLMLITL